MFTSDKNLWKRRNYSKSDNINFLDGDYDSRSIWGKDENINEFEKLIVKRFVINEITVQIRPEKEGYLSNKDRKNQNSFDLDKNEVYDYGKTSLVSDNSKVYKEDHGMTELIGWFQELEDSSTNLYQLLQSDSVVLWTD